MRWKKIRDCLAAGCMLSLAAVGPVAGEGAGAKEGAAKEALAQPVAEMKLTKRGLEWSPRVEYERLVLTVSGQGIDLEREFGADEPTYLELVDRAGAPLPDGNYTYELRVVPHVDPKLRKKLAAAREAQDRSVPVDLRVMKGMPRGPFVQSGYFTLERGAILQPSDAEVEVVQNRPDAGQEVEGDLRVRGDLEVSGTKNFVVPDPDEVGRALYYSALEGPEAGTYYRGSARTRGGEVTIELPSHFAKLTESEGLTVQLTPLGGWSQLYVADKSPRHLVVREAEGRDGIEFDFLIQGVRKGYADFRVERRAARQGR